MQKISGLISIPISFILCCFIVLSVTEQVSASDNPTSINDLVGNPSEYDNQTVTLTGEVIGELMVRQDGCWVNMNDGTNAVGIWISKTDADLIEIFGDYKHTGDTITVTGIFYESCPEHGGEPDVHGSSLSVENRGVEQRETISVEKILLAVGVVSAALILFIIYTSKNRNINQ